MAFEADRVVVELLAKTDGFDAKMEQSASTFEQSTKRVGKASKETEQLLAALRRNLEEALSAGQSQKAQLLAQNIEKIEAAARRAGVAVSGTANAAAGFDKSMVKVDRSARQTRAGMTQLGFQLQDISQGFALGVKPMTIFAQQGGQVIQALQVMNAGSSKFLSFLGGPWGIGLSVAAVALTPLIARLFETKSEVEKLTEKLKENAEKARDAAMAQGIYDRSVEGSITKVNELTKALREQNLTLEDTINLNKAAAAVALGNVVTNIGSVSTQLAAALEQRRAAERAVRLIEGGATGGADPGVALIGAQARLEAAEENVRKLTGQLNALNAAANRGAAALRAVNFPLFERDAKEAVDPIAAINRKFDDMAKKARTAGTYTAALAKDIERLRNIELKAAREAAKKPRAAGGLPAVTAAEVAAALGFGPGQYGGKRSAARNRAVDGAANSYHLTGQAIDIPLTVNGKPLTKAGIRAALAPLGVEIKELLGPGDKGHSTHFHVAFGKKRLAPDQVASAQAKAADELARAIAQEATRRQGFENELAGMRQDELSARRDLITSAEAIAEIELQAIEISRQKYADAVEHQLAMRRLQEGEAAELLEINEERAKLRAELVRRREDERKFRLQEQAFRVAEEFQSVVRSDQAEVLQGQRDLARTAKERARIERQLLDIQFQEERARLEAVISYNERLKLTQGIEESERISAQAAATEAQIRLDSLEGRQANAQAVSDRSNASPLESYFGNIQAQGDDLNTMFEEIAAGGLATFTDALTDAIVNFRSLGDVGRAVLQAVTADLVKLAIQQILLHTIGKALGTTAVAASAAQAAAAGAAWAPAAAMAALATLGANAGPAAAALTGTTALAQALVIPRFREGGRIYGPGGPTADRVPILASPDEYMIRANAAKRIGYDTLEYINRHGDLPRFADGGRVRTISPLNMAAASPGRGGFSQGDIATLRGLIGDAVSAGVGAMPDVNLYASLDPADVLQRALGTPAGEKALVAAMGRNSGRMRATLDR